MPLYEYFCETCQSSFEALAALGASKQALYPCPDCGENSRRILSSVNLATQRRPPTLPYRYDRAGKPDVTRLRLPPPARMCWMDDQSAARLAAYKAGRGAEYDDTIAARRELASQLGDESAKLSPSRHPHSSLSDASALANRSSAAIKEKVAESGSMAKGGPVQEG